jgi:hypothetical protein
MWTKNIDKRLLILQVLYRFYEKNNITEIRYGVLKELCDDRLNYETNGEQEAYGGSFERHLKYLINKGLVKRVSRGKKLTMLISDIHKIEYALQESKLKRSFDRTDKKIIEANVEDSIWEEIIEESFSSALNKIIKSKYNLSSDYFNNEAMHRSHSLMKEFTSKSLANMMSRSFEFNVSYQDNDFQLDREFITTIANPVVKMVQRNPRAPFKITIEYKGIQGSSEEAFVKFKPALLKLRAEYFARWANEVFNYQVSDEDKRKINEGQHFSLSKIADEIYDKFDKNIVFYNTIIQSTTHDQIEELF